MGEQKASQPATTDPAPPGPVAIESHSAVPGQADIECIRANRFELVDKAGKVRGVFGFTDDGMPNLALVDDRGDPVTIRAQLILDEEGPALALYDMTGTQRIVMSTKDSGAASLKVKDARGSLKYCVLLDKDGAIKIRSFDSQKHGWTGRNPRPDFTVAQLKRELEKAANRDGLRGFAQAIGELLDIHDTATIEELWKDAVKRRAKKAEPTEEP